MGEIMEGRLIGHQITRIMAEGQRLGIRLTEGDVLAAEIWARVWASCTMRRLRSIPQTHWACSANTHARNPAPHTTSQTRRPEVGPAIRTIISSSP
jgi:hypothetical protein